MKIQLRMKKLTYFEAQQPAQTNQSACHYIQGNCRREREFLPVRNIKKEYATI